VPRVALGLSEYEYGKKTLEKIKEDTSNEDDYIYSEAKDEYHRIIKKNEKPDEATFRIYGIPIKKKVLHRKSESSNGADLLLEIENEKFAIIQFKKVTSNNRYQFEIEQLDNLGEFCRWCKDSQFLPPQCPCYVWLIDDSGRFPLYRVYRLCELKKILRGRLSAPKTDFYSSGIKRSTFRELFVKCWAGMQIIKKPSDDILLNYIDGTNHVIFNYLFSKYKINDVN